MVMAATGMTTACATPPRTPTERAVVAATPAARGAPPAPEQLLPFRSYLQIAGVGEYGHYYTLWYRDLEQEICDVRVTDERTGPAVHFEGCRWGGYIDPPPPEEPHGPPDRLEQAIFDALELRAPDAREVAVASRGDYRLVRVVESVAVRPGGGAGWEATLALAADEKLQRIERMTELSSGFGGLSNGAGGRWIPYVAPRPSDGFSRLYRLGERLEGHAGDADPLAVAILTEARRAARGEPALPFAQLAALQPKELVPPGLHQHVRLIIQVFVRPKQLHGPLREGQFEVPLAVADLARGHAEGRGRLTLAGRTFAAALLVTGAPVDGAAGAHETARKVALHMWDDAGHYHEWTFDSTAELCVDHDNFGTMGLRFPPKRMADEQRHWQLPGGGSVDAFDVYVDVEMLLVWRD